MTIIRLTLALVLVSAPAWAETSASTVTCKDGSTSKGGRGACRGHGGVDKTKSGGGDAGTAAAPAPAETTVTCQDGTQSHGGRGACRGHGGVDKTKTNAPAPATSPPPAAAKAPAPTPPAATAPPPVAAPAPHAATSSHSAGTKSTGGKAATDDPAGALAKCRDGMYWHGTTHSGSCSHHGGVETWLDGSQKK